MREIAADKLAQYLRDTNRISSGEDVRIRLLTGGVSNIVLHVMRTRGDDFVVKQARPRLRVPDPWFCSVERIWREVEVLKVCAQVLDGSAIETPTVLFEDRENYLFGMTAAPEHEVWKTQLLAGSVDVEVARACGRLMGRLHSATWRDPLLAERLGDRTYFRDLRIDPYYGRVAEVHEDLAWPIARLIESNERSSLCLVHGDFSPKNLLVFDGGLMLIDFEVGHFGDPAFDLGFFASHLALKALRAAPESRPLLESIREFGSEYQAMMSSSVTRSEMEQLSSRGTKHLAACMLARIDGKSQVEYLDAVQREQAREFCRSALTAGEVEWSVMTAGIAGWLSSISR